MSGVITIDGKTIIELSETLVLTDTITKEADIPMSDTLSFTDSLSGVAEIVLSETLSFTDITDGVRSGGLVLPETLSLVDLILVESAPFAPTLTAIPASGQIILSWNQPFNGNLPITDYQIQHSNNNGASWNTINDGVNTGLAFTVLPNYPGCPSEPCIQNGVEAKFRVRAINSMGNGDVSVPVDVTPAVSTSKIQTVTLDNDITGMQGIYVQWTLDPSVGASIICDYLVYYATSAAGPWTLYDDGYSTNRSASLFGISTATSTFVKIEPVLCSTECPDTASEIVWTIPLLMPPDNNFFFTATPEDTKIMLDWNAPANNGGSEIIKYQIQIRTGAQSGERTFMNSTGPHTIPTDAGSQGWVNAFTGIPPLDSFGMYSYMITGLMPMNDYSFAIRAINSMGEGQYWQVPGSASNPRELTVRTLSAGFVDHSGGEIDENFNYNTPVSYTHLTLPTSDLV